MSEELARALDTVGGSAHDAATQLALHNDDRAPLWEAIAGLSAVAAAAVRGAPLPTLPYMPDLPLLPEDDE